MSKQPAQPAQPADPLAAERSRGGDDLESQLNALLAQIEEPDAAAPSQTPAPVDAQATQPVAPEATTSVDAPAAAAPRAAGQAALNEGDQLAQQIQALLDDAIPESDDEPADAPASEPAAAAAPAAESAADEPAAAEAEAEADVETVDPDPAAAAAAAEAEDAQLLEQIDQMLADQANESLAGDFETVSDVLDEDEHTPAADAKDHLLAQAPVKSDGSAAPKRPDPGGLGASAGDVAAELDDQPEPRAAATAASASAQDEEDADEADASPAVVRTGHDWPRRTAELTRRTCELVNRPLHRLTPEVRQTVGYVGLLFVATGTVVLIFGLLT